MAREEVANKRAMLDPEKTWEEFQKEMEAVELEKRVVNILQTLAVWTLQAISVVLASVTLFTFAVVNMSKFVENWLMFGVVTPVDYVSIALGVLFFAAAWYITNRMFDWLWGKK